MQRGNSSKGRWTNELLSGNTYWSLFPGVYGCVILLPFPSSLCAGEYIQGIYYQGRVSQKLEYMLRHLECGSLRCCYESWKRAEIRLVRVIWSTPESLVEQKEDEGKKFDVAEVWEAVDLWNRKVKNSGDRATESSFVVLWFPKGQ